MDFDDVLEKTGNCGRYQHLLYIAVCLSSVPTAFNTMGIVFIAGVPEHWCAPPPFLENSTLSQEDVKNLTIPQNEKGEFSKCEMYDPIALQDDASHLTSNVSTVKCQYGWVYDKSLYTSTVVSQWDLVCDSDWLIPISSSIYMAGLMIGIIIFGNISDLYGRRPTFIVSYILLTIFTITLSFSPNFTVFVILRFIVGVFVLGPYTVAFVFALEIVGKPWRIHAGIGIVYFWTLGYMLYAGMAYGIRDWFTLHLISAFLHIPIFLVFFFIPESPRWLYTNERRDEADKVVHKMANVNKIKLTEQLDVIVKNEKKGFVWDLVRTPNIRCRSINLFFNWFVNSIIYYGLSYNTSNLGGNPYLNFFIAAAVEVPAYMLCSVALMFLGRRWPQCLSMILAGIALLCTLGVPKDQNWLSITLAMFGKFLISGSFAMIYVFSGELYPTVIRNVGVGTGSSFARFGGVIAPFIAQLGTYSKPLPLVVFGILSIAAGLLVLLLPETKDQHLPETIQDGEQFGRKRKSKEKIYLNCDVG